MNVGGTGALPMEQLRAICAGLGFTAIRTYIASGNVLFDTDAPEPRIRAMLATSLHAHAGKPVGVIIRAAAEITDLVSRNPFAGHPGNRVMALFTDDALPADPLHGATGRADEQVRAGRRELFIFYPAGQAHTRLHLPCMRAGTARNMNTVARLADLASNPSAASRG